MFNHWKDTATLPPPDGWVRLVAEGNENTRDQVSEITSEFQIIPLSTGKFAIHFPDMESAILYKLAY